MLPTLNRAYVLVPRTEGSNPSATGNFRLWFFVYKNKIRIYCAYVLDRSSINAILIT
jgi:hypothetical protein